MLSAESAGSCSFIGESEMKKDIRIDLGHVDYDKLSTDADFERVATSVLPKALVQVGEVNGAVAYDELHKGLKSSKFIKVTKSASEKRNFIRESGEEFRRTATAKDRRELKATIIAQLKEQKNARDS